ncbi:MAG: glycosyl transferase family 17 [Candidatus Pelagibacter sp.]|mgnify:CR=1 FL=1|nr:glycosyl transferase family 17 [Candidatus Pelagibacter sp.]OUW23896.1 MAG: hypothetical protein CBD34_01930 [Rickettsiales bacterium TMED174]|tara:strand:+ start:1188 stop:2003 length:816 start_codon:yes stop_codon:yes gene_type:complete
MKLIDCFMYFDEDLVLDIRLNTLDKIVDKFVIVEAKKDHAGNEKNLNFNIKNFAKFKNKISYIVIDDLPITKKFFRKNWRPEWYTENAHRDKLELGYLDASDQDLIMISDIDEIPNPEKISEFKLENMYGCFLQMNFQSKINLINKDIREWAGTKICQKKNLRSPQWLRNIKIKKRPIWKFYKPRQPQLINHGGWHFSFLKTPRNISKKIKSFVHQELNINEFTNTENIEKRIKENKDIFDRKYQYKKIEIDKNFPEYILNNKEKFRDWII